MSKNQENIHARYETSATINYSYTNRKTLSQFKKRHIISSVMNFSQTGVYFQEQFKQLGDVTCPIYDFVSVTSEQPRDEAVTTRSIVRALIKMVLRIQTKDAIDLIYHNVCKRSAELMRIYNHT